MPTSEMSILEKSYQIPLENMEELTSRLSKLNKRAAKLNCPPIKMMITGEETIKPDLSKIICTRYFKPQQKPLTCEKQRETGNVDCRDCDLVPPIRQVTNIEIYGIAPSLGGWDFLGTITELPSRDNSETLTLINTVPGVVDDLSRYRNKPIMCEHCYSHRYRKESFFVKNQRTGQIKQVGRQCLRDFLGHQDPHAIAAWAEALGAFDLVVSGYSGGGFGQSPYHDLKEYLGWVCGAVNRFGWLSSGKANEEGGTPTALVAWREWQEYKHIKPEDRWYPTKEDLQEAAILYDWTQTLLDLPEEDCNDYILNLRVIAKSDVVIHKTKGYAASLWIAHKMQQAREEEKKRKAAQVFCNEWVGKIGDKITFEARVTARIPCETQFGIAFLNKFLDEKGHILTWFQSGGSKAELEENSVYTIKGTIKDQSVYHSDRTHQDYYETQLTRCKVVNIVQQALPLEVEGKKGEN